MSIGTRAAVRRYSASRGGHGPGHLRDALLEAIDGRSVVDWWQGLAEPETLRFSDQDQQRRWDGMPLLARARWLVGQLWNCSDLLPGAVVRDLDLDQDDARRVSTYAQLVRYLAARLP